ncbi:MAG: hypothetical protein WBJ19_00405, partial [Rhodoferax sp.]
LGREGKGLAKPRDAKRYPHTVAMAAKFDTKQGKLDYRKRKWIPSHILVGVLSCGQSDPPFKTIQTSRAK